MKKVTMKQFMGLGNDLTYEEIIAYLPGDDAQSVGYLIYLKGYKDAMKFASEQVDK